MKGMQWKIIVKPWWFFYYCAENKDTSGIYFVFLSASVLSRRYRSELLIWQREFFPSGPFSIFACLTTLVILFLFLIWCFFAPDQHTGDHLWCWTSPFATQETEDGCADEKCWSALHHMLWRAAYPEETWDTRGPPWGANMCHHQWTGGHTSK